MSILSQSSKHNQAVKRFSRNLTICQILEKYLNYVTISSDPKVPTTSVKYLNFYYAKMTPDITCFNNCVIYVQIDSSLMSDKFKLKVKYKIY